MLRLMRLSAFFATLVCCVFCGSLPSLAQYRPNSPTPTATYVPPPPPIDRATPTATPWSGGPGYPISTPTATSTTIPYQTNTPYRPATRTNTPVYRAPTNTSTSSPVSYSATPTSTALPTRTPTSTPANWLHGKTTLRGTSIVIPDVLVKLMVGKKYYQSRSNHRGIYQIDGLEKGRGTVEAESYNARRGPEVVYLDEGENEEDLELATDSCNKVKGIVKVNGQEPPDRLNIRIYVADQRGRTLIGMTVTDSHGRYEYQSCSMRSADTKIAVFPDAAPDARKLAEKGIFFVKNFGGRAGIHFNIGNLPPRLGTLAVVVQGCESQRKYEELEPCMPLEGARVSLERKGTTLARKSNNKGLALFSDLPVGTYNMEVTRPGFVKISKSITVRGWTEFDVEIVNLHKKDAIAPRCERHPMPNVSNFFFCGADAIALYPERMAAWAAIDSKVGELRGMYTNLSDLPLQIVITRNFATYSPAYVALSTENTGGSSESLPDLDKEMIIFEPTFIKEYDDDILVHCLVHEWGHGKDYRTGSDYPISDMEAFETLRNYGQSFRNYFPVLKDGKYEPKLPDAGHPEDNNGETYASAFHDGIYHMAAFQAEANMCVNPLREVLKQTVNEALAGGGNP